MDFKILMTTGLLLAGTCGFAQDKRLRTMLAQLAALKVYTTTVGEGYRTAVEGLSVAREIQGAELALHKVFFSSLLAVNAGVLDLPELSVTDELLKRTVAMAGEGMRVYSSAPWLSAAERGYVMSVLRAVMSGCERHSAALKALREDGVLSMTDGQRLAAIHVVAGRVREEGNAVGDWLESIAWLMTQRSAAQAFIGTLKKWYETE